jgi:hypothetical protein
MQKKTAKLFLPVLISTLAALIAPQQMVPSGGLCANASPFPTVNGWILSADIQLYFPETLFDYIDGAAEQYFRYSFLDLKVAEYRNAQGDLITVEVYRHRSPVEAFGIYSLEQPPDPAILDIGARGYVQGPTLNFTAGPCYVKIFSYEQGFQTQDILRSFAEGVTKQLDGESSLPAILECFPEQRKRAFSEKYIATDFLGYAFLPSAFTAEYADSSLSFQIFIMASKDTAECRRVLKEYLKAMKLPHAKMHPGRYAFEDPYHGAIALVWKERCIWGLIGLTQEALTEKYLSLTGNLLAEHGFITF